MAGDDRSTHSIDVFGAGGAIRALFDEQRINVRMRADVFGTHARTLRT